MSLEHDCPAPEVLGRFYLKATETSEWQAVLEHISRCTPCRRVLAILAQSEAGGTDPATGNGPELRVHPLPPVIKSLAAALLIAMAVGPWRVDAPRASFLPDGPSPRSSVPVLSQGPSSSDPGLLARAPQPAMIPPNPSAELPSSSELQGRPVPAPVSAAPPPGPDVDNRASVPDAAPSPPAPNPSEGHESASASALPHSLTLSPPQEDPIPRPTPELPSHPGDESPHGSILGFLERHLTEEAWKENVWDDYVTRPEILIPIGLALSSAAISHWDRSLERHWEGSLGEHSPASEVGELGLLASAVLIGVLFPGGDRNGWDELWTIGESVGLATLTSYALKSGIPRSHATKSPEREEHGLGFGSRSSSNAFAAWELMERNSGPAIGLPAFGAAVFTAFASLQGGRRYPSDVLAGAAIGTLSAGIFDSLHWGTGSSGGISRPNLKIALDTDALKECKLTVTFLF